MCKNVGSTALTTGIGSGCFCMVKPHGLFYTTYQTAALELFCFTSSGKTVPFLNFNLLIFAIYYKLLLDQDSQAP